MATNIGPKIGIDGEAEYRKTINNIIQQANTLASEMKAVTAGFDSSTTAQEKAAAKSTVLTKQIKVQEQRVAELAKMLEAASGKYEENDNKVLGWQQALNNAKADLAKMERELREATEELEDMGDAADDAADPIRRAGNAMDDAGDGAFSLGDALKAGGIIEGGKAVLNVVMDLIDRTEESRRIMASLEVSSARAGYTAEETAEGFALLYGVLGDDQSSATALANLQALQLEQRVLLQIINGSVGAWSTYGDSIPIDNLAESINETVQVAKVTGTFADVLNWAGRNEDDFNAKLEACADSSERVTLVLQELTDQGLVELGEAWQRNNQDIVANNNATNDLNRAYARFAEMAAPAVNKGLQAVADGLNNTLDWWEANDEAVKEFVGNMNAAEEATVENAQTMNAAFTQMGVNFQNTIGNMISANNQAQLSTAQMSLNVGQSFWEMQQNAGDAVLQFALDIENGVQEAADYLMGLADDAREWGRDWLQEFIDGALAKLPTLEEAAQDVAAVIRKYLHFTVPDVGPLSDADEYGPDFMQLLSKGIRDNIPLLDDAALLAAEAMVIQPHVVAAPQGGSVSTVNRIDGFTVNVYAAEGQSPQEVAEAVKDMIYAEVTRKEAVFGA